MLLDDFMPRWHFGEHHQALAAAPAARCYPALRNIDARRSPLIWPLLLLRGLAPRLAGAWPEGIRPGGTLDDMLALGFMLLADKPPRELVLGLAGRFWTPAPLIARPDPADFAAYRAPGQAKVAANFMVTPLGPNLCRISTETRVQCLDAGAKAAFRRYWSLIRPFSGLIRREWLRLARTVAEGRG